MIFCEKCGVEIPNGSGRQRYCRECRSKKSKKEEKVNEKLSGDVDRARAFKMTYGEYRQFADKVREIK